jgi:hypothetical protein
MHPRDKNLFPDWWWRFDRYEIHQGYIRPAPGAAVETYSPWELYKVPAKKEAITQPYHTLFRLTEMGQPERERELLSWCSKFGLLGVLLHRSESVSVPGSRGLATYTREVGGWRALTDFSADAGASCALVRSLGEYQPTPQPVGQTWGPFFPGLSNPSDYPPPFSEDFWREYAEPVDVFFQAARFLRLAIDRIRTVPRSSAADFINATTLLHSLTSPVRPLLYPKRHQIALGWACGSLLSNFAMMALLDFSTKSRLLICKNQRCGTMFVTNSKGAKYCSPRCRKVVQMRKYRKTVRKRGR